MDSSPRLVLFGPPGAGKGTQAQLLKDRLGVAHISSGDLFRYHLQQETPLGQRVSHYVRQGLLVPDEVTIEILLDKVLAFSPDEGFILDGFPRTTHQAEALEGALASRSRRLDKVVFIDVPEEELRRRLGGRYICRSCQTPHTVPGGQHPPRCGKCGGELYQREDDRPESVKRRIEVYRRDTMPVLEFYRQRGLLADVAGVGGIECINQRVLAALGQEPAARS